MIGYLKRLTIRNIASPYGLAMLSYLIFLFAWFFPPDLYTGYIHEPDLLFMDPQTFIFYTVCVGAFLFGVRGSRFISASPSSGAEPRVYARNQLLYLLVPIIAATLFCSIYLILLGGQINFVALLASQQGNAIKVAGQAGNLNQGRWDDSIPMLTGVLWWGLFRATQLRLKNASKVIFYLVFFAGTGVGLLTCVATVDRTSLTPIVLGLLIVYFYRKTLATNANIFRVVLASGIAGAGTIGIFLTFSFVRGALALRLLMTSLLGYTIVSYNRLAALLTGVMHYAYDGRGVYLSRYVLGNETLNSIFGFSTRFGWPTALGLWQTEFSSTMAAGLNPFFIWSGAFGYIYSDMGWWTIAYLFGIGLVVGYLWLQFRAGKTSALVLYPWFAFSILFWIGSNIMFDGRVVAIFKIGLVLAVYDRMLLRRLDMPNEARASAADYELDFIDPAAAGLENGVA